MTHHFNQVENYKKYANCRVMVVDDEEFCIASMRSMLMTMGLDTVFQVDFCITGEEAFNQLKTVTSLGMKYKVIFTDFSMPVLDGIQATKKMRAYLQGLEIDIEE
jgi:CheY-like chemotaxis protein